MKNMKKMLALMCAAVMLLTLCACGTKPADDVNPDVSPDVNPDVTPDVNPDGNSDEKFVVGICQLVPHVALDAATQGFKDALEEALPGRVEFIDGVGAGDAASVTPIVNNLVAKKVDLILANATGALQVAAASTEDIPVLGTSVTEYGVALEIENFSGLVGSNISGTSDLAPLKEQAEMIKEWFPNAKTVSLLYCSAEANSQYQVDEMQRFLEGMGLQCTQYPFADSNDMAAVTQTAADNCDVMYVPTDNTAASNAGVIDNICRGKIPVFCGEEGICSGCGVATLSISYYDLGVTTGKMAAQILTGQANVSEMPIAYAENFTKKFNKAICDDLGLTAPADYEPIADGE